MKSWQSAGVLALLALCNSVRAQPVTPAGLPEAEERAQKQADKVFTWIRSHGPSERGGAAAQRDAPAAKRTSAGADRNLLEPLETPLPAIPQELRREVTSGFVQVKFTVDTSGRVTAVEPVKSTSPKLNRTAVDTVMGWRFKPLSRPQHGVADLDFKPAAP